LVSDALSLLDDVCSHTVVEHIGWPGSSFRGPVVKPILFICKRPEPLSIAHNSALTPER
jgi:hypothetical protein